MDAKELRNQIVNKLWSYNKLPKNIQTLMTDNDVDFMMEIIKTHVAEQLLIHSVVGQSEQYYCEIHKEEITYDTNVNKHFCWTCEHGQQ